MNDGMEQDWRVLGECSAGRNPDIWFSTAVKNLREAKRLCGRCPVRQQCLAFALRESVSHGVWGGMSESERRSLPRGKRRESLVGAGAT